MLDTHTLDCPTDLRQRPEVQATRQHLCQLLARLTPAEEDAEHAAAVREVLTLLEQDPTLALRSETDRMMDLIGELARQLRPLRRQAAPAPEHTRARAEHDLAEVRGRLRRCCQRLREQTRPDWDTPHQRRALALERMPGPETSAQTIAAAADRLRRSVQGALDIDPDLPEARRLLDLAARIEALDTARTCAAPRCDRPLPEEEAERGRDRRYCSPACRRRAKR